MPTRPSLYRPRPAPTRREQNREVDQWRGSAHSRGYDGKWRKARLSFLAAHPLCEYCEAGAFDDARTVAADLVDHLYPHQGDKDLFWSSQWWVSCCTACHSGPKQAAERRGVAALDTLARHLDRPEKRHLRTSRA